MYAIINLNGNQYKVSEGDKIEVDKLELEEGKTLKIEEVLLLSDKEVKVGTPYVEKASVELKSLGDKKGEKVRVFKMKPKKRYRRTLGSRPCLTTVEVVKISS